MTLSLVRCRVSLADWRVSVGPLGACAYIAGFALPFDWDLPLAVLAASGCLAIAFSRMNSCGESTPILYAVLIFLVGGGLSILASRDIGRSLRLSAALVPAVLLFFLIANYFRRTGHIRLLYLTFSGLGLGLAAAVLWKAWSKGWAVPEGFQNWISEVGSPVLIVPNDTALLAVLAPLSVALLFCDTPKPVRVLAVSSILLSVAAVCVIRSRLALLTMVASVAGAAVLLKPRAAALASAAVLVGALLVDGSLGFPLFGKFGRLWESGFWDARISIWSAAWAEFLKTPLLGSGLHTFDYTSPDAVQLRWAHNLYLETLAEQGVIGLAALGWLFASALVAAGKVRATGRAEIRTLGAGALAAFLAFCLAALFELSFLRQWVVIILFALLGVIAQLASFKPPEETKA